MLSLIITLLVVYFLLGFLDVGCIWIKTNLIWRGDGYKPIKVTSAILGDVECDAPYQLFAEDQKRRMLKSIMTNERLSEEKKSCALRRNKFFFQHGSFYHLCGHSYFILAA